MVRKKNYVLSIAEVFYMHFFGRHLQYLVKYFKIYVCYSDRHYKPISIFVFEGYNNGPSTKDQEHLRNSMGLSSGYPDVKIDVNLQAPESQHTFFSNEMNKKCFMGLLMVLLDAKGWEVSSTKDDADNLIVVETLDLVYMMKDVVVFAENTYIKFILPYFFNSEMGQTTLVHLGAKNQQTNLVILKSICQHQCWTNTLLSIGLPFMLSPDMISHITYIQFR